MNDIAPAISLHPVRQNIECAEWGPNGLLAVASEHFLFIYQLIKNSFKLVQTITKHISNITCIRWSTNSVEFNTPNSFKLYIAIGDASGNCLIYKLSNGMHFAGISLNKPLGTRIVDIKWSLRNPNVLFILTSVPSLIAVSLGIQRRSSTVTPYNSENVESKVFNLKPLFSVALKQQMDQILLDYYHTANILLIGHKKIYIKISVNGKTATVSLPAPLQNIPGDTIIHAEFFPIMQNYITIMTEHSLMIYDISTDTVSPFLYDKATSLCKVANIFNCAIKNKFWCAHDDGTLSRFALTDDDTWGLESALQCGLGQTQLVASDIFSPGRAAVFQRNGRVLVVEDRNSKLWVVAAAPYYPTKLASWCTAPGKSLSFVTQSGALYYGDGTKSLKFQLGDTPSGIACTDSGRVGVICKSGLWIVDIEKRSTVFQKKAATPLSILAAGDRLVLQPLPSIIDIIYANMFKRTIAFQSSIIAFAVDRTNCNRIAVCLQKEQLYVIDTSQEKATQIRLSLPEGVSLPADLAIEGETLVVATKRCEVVFINIQTKESNIVRFSVSPLRSVRILGDSVLVTDVDNGCGLISVSGQKVVHTAKWNLLDARFVDGDSCVIQTSLMSLRRVRLPLFETFALATTVEREMREEFVSAKSVEEFERAALLNGDLNFVMFSQAARRKDSIPLPTVVATTHRSFVLGERAFSACTRGLPELSARHVELLVFTGQTGWAASELMATPTRENVLLAAACLARADAAELARMWDGHEEFRTVALLMAVAGDYEGAFRVLLRNGDGPGAFRLLKCAFDDEEAAPLFGEWLDGKDTLLQSPSVLAAGANIDATLDVLFKAGEISKAHAFLTMIGGDVKDRETVKAIEEKWQSMIID